MCRFPGSRWCGWGAWTFGVSWHEGRCRSQRVQRRPGRTRDSRPHRHPRNTSKNKSGVLSYEYFSADSNNEGNHLLRLARECLQECVLIVSTWIILRVCQGEEVLRATRDYRASLAPRVREAETADVGDLVPLACRGFLGSQGGRACQERRESPVLGGRMAVRDQKDYQDK